MNTQLILSNASPIDDDGWALIAPFGEHPKSRVTMVNGRPREQKFIQILDNAAADQLLDKENGFFRKMARAIIGIPVYRDHPDLAVYAPETLANQKGKKEVIGVVDEVRKGARGVEAHFNLTPGGADAVENDGCKYPSALWLVLPVGGRDGATLCRPYKLLSVGLTSNPNISGVESLSNQSDPMQENEFRSKLVGMLIALGCALPNEASDEQLLNAAAAAALDNGDVPGHVFHGNQYAAGAPSSASNKASTSAAHASSAAMKSGSAADHQKAASAHRAAAAAANKAGNGALAMHHDILANLHGDAAAAAKPADYRKITAHDPSK